MKRAFPLAAAFLAVVAVITAVVLLWPSPSTKQPASGDKAISTQSVPTVAATIFPLFDIVRGVAGDSVQVIQIVPSGASPHTFEPTPSLLTDLKGTTAVFAVGHGLDDWNSQIAAAIVAETVTLDKNLNLLRSQDEEEGGDGTDPHYWLDPTNVKTMAETVEADLSRRWPAKAAAFQANLVKYLGAIDAADAQAKSLLASISNRKIVTMHDAWFYFSRHFNLEVAGTLEPTAGREPTPQYLANLSQTVKSAGVVTIYTEPQLSTDVLKPFLDDHGLKVAVIDPLGGASGGGGLAELFVYNAQIISQNQ